MLRVGHVLDAMDVAEDLGHVRPSGHSPGGIPRLPGQLPMAQPHTVVEPVHAIGIIPYPPDPQPMQRQQPGHTQAGRHVDLVGRPQVVGVGQMLDQHSAQAHVVVALEERDLRARRCPPQKAEVRVPVYDRGLGGHVEVGPLGVLVVALGEVEVVA